MGNVVYTSRARVERLEGRHRRIEVPGATEPLDVGVHGAIAAHYGVDPEDFPSDATTIDYLVAAAGG